MGTVGKQTTAQKCDAHGIEAVCERIAGCATLQVIADGIGISKGSLIVWLATHPDQYARAREAQADKMADDILTIADEEVTMVKRSKHQPGATEDDDMGDVEVCFDPTAVARNRLRVDARKWLASKMAPKRYGEKIDVEHSGGVEITSIERKIVRPPD